MPNFKIMCLYILEFQSHDKVMLEMIKVLYMYTDHLKNGNTDQPWCKSSIYMGKIYTVELNSDECYSI